MAGNAFRASAEWLADRLSRQAAVRTAKAALPDAEKPPETAIPGPPSRSTKRPATPVANPLESAVLAAVFAAVKLHPAVAFAWRANTGRAKFGQPGEAERFVTFGFTGQSDILGMLKGGRFLAVEVKRASGGVTQAQHAFLSRVNRGGGLAFVARSVDDAVRMLNESKGTSRA